MKELLFSVSFHSKPCHATVSFALQVPQQLQCRSLYPQEYSGVYPLGYSTNARFGGIVSIDALYGCLHCVYRIQMLFQEESYAVLTDQSSSSWEGSELCAAATRSLSGVSRWGLREGAA